MKWEHPHLALKLIKSFPGRKEKRSNFLWMALELHGNRSVAEEKCNYHSMLLFVSLKAKELKHLPAISGL